MSDPLCLTDEEVEALREVLAALATLEERGFRNDKRLVEVSREVWHDMLVRPAEPLMRRLSLRLGDGT